MGFYHEFYRGSTLEVVICLSFEDTCSLAMDDGDDLSTGLFCGIEIEAEGLQL